jgi:hypothetical protein
MLISCMNAVKCWRLVFKLTRRVYEIAEGPYRADRRHVRFLWIDTKSSGVSSRVRILQDEPKGYAWIRSLFSKSNLSDQLALQVKLLGF